MRLRPKRMRFAATMAGLEPAVGISSYQRLEAVGESVHSLAEEGVPELANIDIQVITAPSVRLDVEVDRKSLAETVAALKPRMLILDPRRRAGRSRPCGSLRRARCGSPRSSGWARICG